MKTIITFLLLVVGVLAKSQSLNKEFGFAYTFAAPMATMQQNISRGHGFSMDYYFLVTNRLAIGADFGLVIYGHDKSRQEYTFSDGTVAPMDIIVSNSFFNYMLGTRYSMGNGKNVKPYVSFRAGYTTFRTNLSIYDPDDTDHCEPIDRDILLKDGTFSASAGGGIQWDMSTVFNRIPSNTFLFNLGAAITLGGKVNYMNTDAPGHHHMPNNDVNAQFINTQTQVVHKHHIGYVYTSYVELIELRAGFVMRLPALK